MKQLPEQTIRPLRRRSLLLAASACAMAPAWAQGSTWNPTRPIKVVIPFPAGGGADTTFRAMSDRLAQKLGQPLIVDNRPGAAGAIGAEAVYRAAPDGYALLFTSADVISLAPHQYLKLPYKPLEFVPVGPGPSGGIVLVGRADLEAKTFPALVELARKRELSFASWGNGSPAHIGAEMFRHYAKVPKILNVPYLGGAPATQALIAGQVDMMFMPSPLWLAFQSKVTTFAAAAKTRFARHKELPTLAELGMPIDLELWHGLFAPPQTPRPVVDRLAKALAEVMAEPEVRKKYEDLGLLLPSGSPDEFAKSLAPDVARWGENMRLAGVQPQ